MICFTADFIVQSRYYVMPASIIFFYFYFNNFCSMQRTTIEIPAFFTSAFGRIYAINIIILSFIIIGLGFDLADIANDLFYGACEISILSIIAFFIYGFLLFKNTCSFFSHRVHAAKYTKMYLFITPLFILIGSALSISGILFFGTEKFKINYNALTPFIGCSFIYTTILFPWLIYFLFSQKLNLFWEKIDNSKK